MAKILVPKDTPDWQSILNDVEEARDQATSSADAVNEFVRSAPREPLWTVDSPIDYSYVEHYRGKDIYFEGEHIRDVAAPEVSRKDSDDFWHVDSENNVAIFRHLSNGRVEVNGEDVNSLVGTESPQHGSEYASVIITGESFNETDLIFADATNQSSYYTLFNPKLVKVNDNEILCFLEGRISSSDFGEKEVVYKRLTYSNGSWSIGPLKTLIPRGSYFGGNTLNFGSGSSIRLRHGPNEGRIIFWAFAHNDSYDNGTIVQIHSDDGGSSWSSVKNLDQYIPTVDVDTATRFGGLIPEDAATELSVGRFKGRIVLSTWTKDQNLDITDKDTRVKIIWSDDYGSTWEEGPLLPQEVEGHKRLNESHIAERRDGKIFGLARPALGYKINQHHVRFLLSPGGVSLEKIGPYRKLEISETQANVVQPFSKWGDPPQKLMVSSIKNRPGGAKTRNDLRVYVSNNMGSTWPVNYRVENGESNYMSMIPFTEDKFVIADQINTFTEDAKVRMRSFSISDLYKNNQKEI